MKKGLTVLLTCTVLAGSTLAQAQEQAYGNTIVSNKPHKQTTVQKPASAASSEVKPAAAAPQAQTAKPVKAQKEKPAKAAKKTAAPKQQKKQDKQMNLMEYNAVAFAQEIAQIDMDSMTPRDALNQLYLLREKGRKI